MQNYGRELPYQLVSTLMNDADVSVDIVVEGKIAEEYD